MFEEHKYIQGMFAFEGRGLEVPVSFEPRVVYRVPSDKHTHVTYCRLGNPTTEFLYVVVERDGKPIRLFPCGAKNGIHVPHAVHEDILPDSVIELRVAAPEGVAAKVMIDLGLVEV